MALDLETQTRDLGVGAYVPGGICQVKGDRCTSICDRHGSSDAAGDGCCFCIDRATGIGDFQLQWINGEIDEEAVNLLRFATCIQLRKDIDADVEIPPVNDV